MLPIFPPALGRPHTTDNHYPKIAECQQCRGQSKRIRGYQTRDELASRPGKCALTPARQLRPASHHNQLGRGARSRSVSHGPCIPSPHAKNLGLGGFYRGPHLAARQLSQAPGPPARNVPQLRPAVVVEARIRVTVLGGRWRSPTPGSGPRECQFPSRNPKDQPPTTRGPQNNNGCPASATRSADGPGIPALGGGCGTGE